MPTSYINIFHTNKNETAFCNISVSLLSKSFIAMHLMRSASYKIDELIKNKMIKVGTNATPSKRYDFHDTDFFSRKTSFAHIKCESTLRKLNLVSEHSKEAKSTDNPTKLKFNVIPLMIETY